MMNNFKIDFIGIGAQKSATSWISRCLSEHPSICFYKGKETHFFSAKYSQDISSYKELFNTCAPKKLKGEFSTSYLADPDAFKRIYKHFPDTKILLCLRNPIDRSISNYFHLANKAKYNNYNLERLIKAEPSIIDNSLYAKHLTKFRSIFSKKNIKIVYYKDISKDPKNFIKDIYDFLNIDSSFIAKSLYSVVNTRSERSSSLYKLINKVFFKFKKNLFGIFFINIFKKIGINYHLVNRIVNKNKSRSNLINKKDRALLYSFFEKDIKNLENILNVDLSNWK